MNMATTGMNSANIQTHTNILIAMYQISPSVSQNTSRFPVPILRCWR